MTVIPSLIQPVLKTQHGFTDIQKTAGEVFASHGRAETFSLAKELFTSEVFQALRLATFLFGKLAAKSKKSFAFLRKHASQDGNWCVQEILAKAFDQYCEGR